MREPRDVRVAVDVGGHGPGLWQLRAEPQRTALSGRGVYALRRPDWQNQGVGRRMLIALFRRLAASGLDAAIVWVLRDNPSRFFYERLGGRLVSHKPIPIGDGRVEALAYGWPDLPAYLAAVSSEDREPDG